MAWGSGCVEEIFHQVDGVVEHVIVGATYVDAQLAAEFGAEGGPVALQDGAEIVNGVADRVRAEMFRRIGLEDLLSPRVFG